MRSIVFIGQIVLSSTLATALYGQTASDHAKPKIIPLKEIWAYEMPGTRDVRKLEPDHYGDSIENLGSAAQVEKIKKSLTFQIMDHLGSGKLEQPALPGFVVVGSGVEALRAAHDVLVKGQKPRESFPAHAKLSLVFFSKALEYYVHLDRVELQTDTITINYFFVPHRTQVMTSHFALIPIGGLQPGEVKVALVRSPIPQKLRRTGTPAPPKKADSKIVCRPFTFTIERQAAEK